MRLTRITTVAAASVALLALAGCSQPAAEGPAVEGPAALADGTLIVATEGTYPPFSYHEDGAGELTGYDVEVAKAVGEKLGVEVQFEETQWDAIFAGLDAGRFETIANQVTINDERKAKYTFSTPYTVSPGVIVVPEDNTDITSFDDLEGKTTAQSMSSNWGALAEESGADVQAVEGWAQSIALLEQGRIDATINDKLTFLDYAKQHPDAPIKIAAETPEAGEMAFVFTKENAELAEAIDGALAELAEDGTLAELGEQFFGEDVSK
ncbi:amino acid ABC transporter substrate-binding protein [Microbacterium paludicola]|uniref:Amino acid ABC transporter substrate-binding protein n=1 Tax=Microbacterium paludicola TaxID=300019 RepID=A0A4Y9FU40_9MICO|nr:amino acid ABC transporter substrate-binding protein [Microbacterium paludicola]MBF0816566.1 amino acid ABC transporter substrate-binding protein [Microbacterium paludicola]TFU32758.1 amino acid ABC transporter substrate-binding protein [Microbacterium paludicola]